MLHALHEFEQFYNGHRPHQGIANARTPLQRLATQTDANIDAIREALRVLHDAGHAMLARNGEPTYAWDLTEHAGFTLTLLPIEVR